MRLLTRDISLLGRKMPLAVIIWFGLAAIAAISEIVRGPSAINNYQIFTGVFRHTLQQLPLYAPYPAEYIDTNHYGPLFSILIAPFALLPDSIGCFAWCIVNAWVLFYAIKQLPFSQEQKMLILWIVLVEMMTAIHNVQFNPMLTGWLLLCFVLVQKEKDGWATFFIAAGFLVKLYGIVGIAFFWFSRHKIKFIGSLLCWLILLFCLPMLISSPAFIIQSYQDWFHSLVEKNAQNINTGAENLMQDISVMGMIRRIGGITNLSNIWVLGPAAISYLLPLLRFRQYASQTFRLLYLCLLMIGAVIFSSSAESSTFVIAVTGIAIWYMISRPAHKKANTILLGFVILLTSLSATDLFPPYVRNHFIRPYSLKALPCFVMWMVILYRLLREEFVEKRAD
jgi:hypothetical protein